MTRMKRHISIALLSLLVACSLPVRATNLTDRLHFSATLGYNLGGTAPIGLPATIRHLNSYTPQFTPAIGFRALLPLQGNWGVQTGVIIENKAMKEDAQVKNYHMEITRGGETLAGMFTGDVLTRVYQWCVTIPVTVTYTVGKVNLKAGPYLSRVLTNDFSGYAHNGYLRVDDPTGPKVTLGEAPNERGDYDFDEHMRHWFVGVVVGADWTLSRHFGLFADLNWGLNAVMKSDFHTIEQNLYPIYGTLGVTYRLR